MGRHGLRSASGDQLPGSSLSGTGGSRRSAIASRASDSRFCAFWKKALNPSLRGSPSERLLGGDHDVEGITYPQLHALWHVFVVCGSYSAITVAAYAHAVRVAPRAKPRLHYWPRELLQWGLPYVAVEDEQP